MIFLTPFAAILIGGLGAGIAHEVVLPWILEHGKQALKHFWKVSPESLVEENLDAEVDLIENSKEEETVEVPARSSDESYAQGVHELETQASLVYQELDNSRAQIRLLYIASAPQRDDDLYCTFKPVNLQTSESYTALSYQWGSPTSDLQTISLNGRSVTVTRNLYEALKELRARRLTTVWVDQLCLNQLDKNEMARQFERMALIYSRAEQVFAWLGCDDFAFVELKYVFDELVKFRENEGYYGKALTQQFTLHDLLHMWVKQPVGNWGVMTARAREKYFPAFDKMLKDHVPSLGKEDRELRFKQLHFLKMLSSVVANEYWRRAWVLQELNVAPQVQLSCGEHSLDFGLLCKIIQELQILEEEKIFPGFTQNHWHIFHIAMLRSKWQPRQPIHLLTALQKSHLTVATKKRDKIYSLLGVCFDSNRFITDIDTESSIEVIMRRMTEMSIRTTRTLDIICVKSRSSTQDSRLPSWAPDWLDFGGDKFNDRLIKYLIGQDDHPKQTHGDNLWRATNNSRHDLQDDDRDGRVLKVRGRRIGSISYLSGAVTDVSVTDPATWKAKTSNLMKAALTSAGKLLSPFERTQSGDMFEALTVYKPKDRIDDDSTHFDDLWGMRTTSRLKEHAPTANKWLEQHKEFPIHGERLSYWAAGRHGNFQLLEQFKCKVHRFLYHFVIGPDTSGSATASETMRTSIDCINERVDKLADSVVRVLKDGQRLMGGNLDLAKPKKKPESKQAQRFYENGFTGWAHPLAKPKDQIYLLKGCSMPVILRPSEEEDPEFGPTYCVIGDAYVVKAMHGEAWTDCEDVLQDLYLV